MYSFDFAKQLIFTCTVVLLSIPLVYSELSGNTSDPLKTLAIAKETPCSTAVRLYSDLSRSETVNDSVKAIAFCRLGDYNLTLKEYSKAIESYRQAAKISSIPLYRHKWAFASMAAGDYDAAQSLWHTLSLEYGDEVSQMANYYLGLLQLKKTNYQGALNFFMKTGKANPQHYWTIASLAGKLECVSRLGMTDKVKLYSEQLKPFQKELLEKDIIALSVSDFPQTATDSLSATNQLQKSNEVNDSSVLFTLQIGAFGSAENASNLQKKLSQRFKDVSVIKAKPGEQIFYRVRIGSFTTKESAQLFATDSLTNSGLNYTIVQK